VKYALVQVLDVIAADPFQALLASSSALLLSWALSGGHPADSLLYCDRPL
jgi:hypothetical protein